MSSRLEARTPSTDWPDQFRRFATQECPGQPLYVALCQALAALPELPDWMACAPAAQARPNLLLAALHERVLAGIQHPLTAYYPSVGGRRAPDAELPTHLAHFMAQERAAIEEHLRQRATQTNEAGRCAVLRLALDTLAARSGASALALFEFGASAGLNLGVAADSIDFGAFRREPIAGNNPRLQLRCAWQGPQPPAPTWTLHASWGTDIAPVNANNPAAARWLQACVWPDDAERLQRLQQALAWARQSCTPVRRSTDGLTDLAGWLPTLPGAVQPVLLNSWVLTYLSPAERAAYAQRALDLVAQQGLAWISAESPALHKDPVPSPPPGLPQAPTLWRLHTRQGVHDLCWSHPHGAWAVAI